MRSKKAIINIFVLIILQLVTIVFGIIIPNIRINIYGSEVNGLLLSINQFLSYIVLLEAGVGGVIRAALYKPLANKDIGSISSIIKSAEKFFKKLATIFIIYLFIMSIILPNIVDTEFNNIFIFSLVIIMGVSTIFQYYFGIIYQILLQADQRQYITSIIQIITIIINSILIITLMKLKINIHIVMLCSSIIFVIRPIILSIYVKKTYKINLNCSPDDNAIKHRWDGLGHHIAFLIHNNTDVAVLTLLTSVKEVSVYSIYFLIVSNIKTIITTVCSTLESGFGNMIAKNEKKALDRNFNIFELIVFIMVSILFTSTALLILPFIILYTKGIEDINYYRPLFAYILILGQAIYCIRIPYNAIILAAGHYKETKKGAFIEALINIIVSVIMVFKFGLVGVAIGTLCAMLFRTIEYAMYLSKNILERSINKFIKKSFIYSLNSILIILLVNILDKVVLNSYIEWAMYSIKIVFISIIVTAIVTIIFYRNIMKDIFLLFKNIVKKDKAK